MNEADLIARHPLLWHMAEDGSWPSIREHGLLSTSALLDLYGVTGTERGRLERERRPQSVTISKAGLPDAVVRDQKPMSDSQLLKCLEDGLTPAQWYATLNTKTFFWVSRQRLDRLLGARAYRGKPQVILTVDTASLVASACDRIRLCSINSGATLWVPQKRGLSTFRSIDDFPHELVAQRRAGQDAIVELVVEEGVPDVADHVIAVDRLVDGASTSIWRRTA